MVGDLIFILNGMIGDILGVGGVLSQNARGGKRSPPESGLEQNLIHDAPPHRHRLPSGRAP
jgi:hypothetical protein